MSHVGKAIVAGLLLLLGGVVLGTALNGYVGEKDEQVSMLGKLQAAYHIVVDEYVDPVDTVRLTEGAISGMLEDLDPHSVYISPERMRRIEEDFEGSFEGIGIAYERVGGTDGGDTITVLTVVPGGPSEEAGLLSGDRLVAIEGADAIGMPDEEVQHRLKGPRGTEVTVTLQRPGSDETFDVMITRDRIPLATVDVAYMLDERTGFIKLNRFARTTHSEFVQAVTRLKEMGMERLVLDLRDNTGGYMQMAVRVADEFLPRDHVIVTEQSRLSEHNRSHTARSGGLLEDAPVIVLVNERSASASEIVSGAIQDHDRGLVVGRRTFGKGLVQQQFSLRDGSALRVTVARYYTPSGRVIQSPYEQVDHTGYYEQRRRLQRSEAVMTLEEIREDVPDSLLYTTAGGRTVIGGGGVMPDILVPPDSSSRLLQVVLRENLDNQFARVWMDQHGDTLHEQWADREDDFVRNFSVDAEMFEAFVAYLRDHGVEIVNGAAGDELSEGVKAFTREELAADRNYLETRLKARMAHRLFDRGAWYQVHHTVDRTLQEGMAHWARAEELSRGHKFAREGY